MLRRPGLLAAVVGVAALALGAGCAAKSTGTVEVRAAVGPVPPASVGTLAAGGVTTTVAPEESIPTPEEFARANADLGAQYKSGWLRADGGEGHFPGEPVPEGSFLPTGLTAALRGLDDPDRTPIYDAPNGTVIGFSYNNLGWVSLERSHGFDPAAARTAKYGCDPVLDEVCNRDLAQRAR